MSAPVSFDRETLFARHVRTLAASWRVMVAAHPGSWVVEDDAVVASHAPAHPVLDNAVLLGAEALARIDTLYPPTARYAVWTRSPECAATVEASGLVRTEVTHPMVALLEDAPPPTEAAVASVVAGAPLAVQSTQTAVGLYAGLGFRDVGTWQEWQRPEPRGAA
jgi:hypothetical protein